MRRVALSGSLGGRTVAAPAVRYNRLFSTSSIRPALLGKDKDPQDPSKEATDTVGQAKNQEGATPATQQANIVKQQGPGAQTQGRDTSQDASSNSGTESSTHEASGLGTKKKGEKPGEAAVNPAVGGQTPSARGDYS